MVHPLLNLPAALRLPNPLRLVCGGPRQQRQVRNSRPCSRPCRCCAVHGTALHGSVGAHNKWGAA